MRKIQIVKNNRQSLQEVHESVDTTNKKGRFKKFFAFLGPAYLVSIGYMDPGNWATDIAAGSKYGYTLIWILLMSNLMALLLQSLSARLGIVRKADLAQTNREYYPKRVNFVLWVLAEIAIAATDLAEVLGMAIGLNLLFGMPLIWGVAITVLDTFLLLWLQRLGMRKMELFIVGLIFVIGGSFLVNLVLAQPEVTDVLKGLIPSLPDSKDLYAQENVMGPLPKETALYLGIGIIGATVMPHNLYLHSALVQTRKIGSDPSDIKRALKANFIDSAIALNLAFLVNAGILILSAAVFFKTGRTDIAGIEDAHVLLEGSLNSSWAPKLFAIALIAAGQSSTVTGTLAGQIVMEGYLHLRLNPLLRRLITRLIAVVPAVLVIYFSGDKNVDFMLILSQVILSMQLGFAIIPLIHFVSDKAKMGQFTIKPWVKFLAWLVTAVLVYLNLRMMFEETVSILETSDSLWLKGGMAALGIFIVLLLGYVIAYPFLNKTKHQRGQIHGDIKSLEISKTAFNHIAITVDFSDMDSKAISYALMQGNANTTYSLLHVLESVAAKYLGSSADDKESKGDERQMEKYVQQLKEAGYNAEGYITFGNRSADIIKFTKSNNVDLIVMGSHGHRSFKDLIYGTTIDVVRHGVNVPIFVVKT
ncbi:Nramp family divalent metal transporter [Polluticaenibacter yanchengensis]|uniref:Divalent metal cation transporter MntH n=1 Tax=Polluticaenibacter yanchengensis TaxID=3014562 RepID=A0ABT4UL53_9BACT|nr:Nramp family divalent metal transporter [Chitinophagaceae bacterium LY-5]